MESSISIQDHSVELSSACLLSMERLDRSSPELWPEQIPGINDYSRTAHNKNPEWMGEFNAEDKKLLLGLSVMNPTALVTEVKKLYDAAYKLGVEESKEMTRGMYLKVLQKDTSKSPSSSSS